MLDFTSIYFSFTWDCRLLFGAEFFSLSFLAWLLILTDFIPSFGVFSPQWIHRSVNYGSYLFFVLGRNPFFQHDHKYLWKNLYTNHVNNLNLSTNSDRSTSSIRETLTRDSPPERLLQSKSSFPLLPRWWPSSPLYHHHHHHLLHIIIIILVLIISSSSSPTLLFSLIVYSCIVSALLLLLWCWGCFCFWCCSCRWNLCLCW